MMYRLFCLLKERPSDRPVTGKEIELASGKKVLDPGTARVYFNDLEIASENIRAAFEKQAINAAVIVICLIVLVRSLTPFQEPWDQEKFEQLLAEWIVACDQPFEEVERPEFRALLIYVHHLAPNLKIPHRDAIRRRIMRMCEETIEDTKKMFEVRILSYTLSTQYNIHVANASSADRRPRQGQPLA